MNWEQKYDALASMIEGYRHERNEALERVRLLEIEVERVNAREDATRRELAETRIDMRDAQRERDEARAEVERSRTEVASSLAMASAEADVLRGFGCMEDGDGPCGVCRECFYRHGYRRGAEAMREACAVELDRILTAKGATAIWVSADEIRATRLPEAKP